MEEKLLYLMAKFDENTQNIFAEYYDILCRNGFVGSQTKNIPYHFTLGSRNVDCESQTIKDIEKICVDTKSFEINLGYIGLFGLKVLFISPNMNFELLKLQQSFFPDCGNGSHPWAAHATLLIDEPEIILKALPLVAENFRPFKARIESIELYEFFPMRFIKSCNL
ncbi:MAG: 2'-5' RNA ligase, partial [Oscillospiraceae bacterium]|nr:2'-5' RNA ligase [Oscillospiraceae bacterium]